MQCRLDAWRDNLDDFDLAIDSRKLGSQVQTKTVSPGLATVVDGIWSQSVSKNFGQCSKATILVEREAGVKEWNAANEASHTPG